MNPNMKFDKYQFAKALKSVQGGKTQTEFAAKAGISKGHMSKLVNAFFDNPPNHATINKIAAVIDNPTQVKLLYETAGFSYQNEFNDLVSAQASKVGNHPFIVTNISPHLDDFLKNSTFKWDHEYGYSVKEIRIFDEPIKYWRFYDEFLYESFFRHYDLQSFINKKYGEITSEEFETADAKFTFVTIDNNIFEEFVDKPPRNLKCIASVALFDPISNKFTKEEYLKTGIYVSQALKAMFSIIK